MRRLDPLVEARLREMTLRWRSHRVVAALATFGTIFALVLLSFGLSIHAGWPRSGPLAVIIALLLLLFGGVALLVVVVVAAIDRLPRPRLAEALEGVRPDLLDRVNTLVFLEEQPAQAPESYARRIEIQAAHEVAGGKIASPFPLRTRRLRFAVCLASLVAAVGFWAVTRPWTKLSFDEGPQATTAEGKDATEIDPPPPGVTGGDPPWGEVRITEPGHDLKVTKVDVVPLQIEAAASETLSGAQWLTAVGGGPSTEHRLPSPTEPHYAVYKPLLYMDELRLADWDVLSYHASASTKPGQAYASEVYFIEVRPFREDILKLPGGEGGKAYALLNELSGLIDRQKHVYRETHLAVARPRKDRAGEAQDRQKLSDAEHELAEAARHAYGKIAALEHADVAVVLDQLARAEELLSQASGMVRVDAARALPTEQEALTALVATRKRLQKMITDDPSAFSDGGEKDEERSRIAELPDNLKKIAEFRDEQKAVREALARAAKEQERIAEEAARQKPPAGLAQEQQRLKGEVQDLTQQHPRHFSRAQEEAKQAGEAMGTAERALSGGTGGAETKAAHDALSKLRDAVARRGDSEQLGQAYALRDELAKQAREMGQMAGSEHADVGQARAAAEAARSTSRALKSLVDETDVGKLLEGPLKDAVAGGSQRAREVSLDTLSKAEEEGARRQAADRARRNLEGLTDAFDQSAPKVVRDVRKEDTLQEKAADAMERGLRELLGLTSEKPGGNPEDTKKQGRDAVAHLERGARESYKNDPRMAKLLLEVRQAVEGEVVDAPRLRKLLEEIERFRVEMGEARVKKPERPDLRHVDASRLPPAYRDRIQRYFEMLSEQ